MYRTTTKRVAIRLNEHDERLISVVFKAPIARVLNRALEIYCAYLQRSSAESLAKKSGLTHSDRRPGVKRVFNIRVRRDLADYVALNGFRLTATIVIALAFYEDYYNNHDIERELLTRSPCYYWSSYLDIDYLLNKAAAG